MIKKKHHQQIVLELPSNVMLVNHGESKTEPAELTILKTVLEKEKFLLDVSSCHDPKIPVAGVNNLLVQQQAEAKAKKQKRLLTHEAERRTINGFKATFTTHAIIAELSKKRLISTRPNGERLIPDFINITLIELSQTDTEHGTSKEQIAVTMRKFLDELNNPAQSVNPAATIAEREKVLKNLNLYKEFIRVIVLAPDVYLFQYTRLIYAVLDNYAHNLLNISKPINTSKKTKTLCAFIEENQAKYPLAYEIIEYIKAQMDIDFFASFPRRGSYQVYYDAVMQKFNLAFELQLSLNDLFDSVFVKYAQLVQCNQLSPRGTTRIASPASSELYDALSSALEKAVNVLQTGLHATQKFKSQPNHSLPKPKALRKTGPLANSNFYASPSSFGTEDPLPAVALAVPSDLDGLDSHLSDDAKVASTSSGIEGPSPSTSTAKPSFKRHRSKVSERSERPEFSDFREGLQAALESSAMTKEEVVSELQQLLQYFQQEEEDSSMGVSSQLPSSQGGDSASASQSLNPMMSRLWAAPASPQPDGMGEETSAEQTFNSGAH